MRSQRAKNNSLPKAFALWSAPARESGEALGQVVRDLRAFDEKRAAVARRIRETRDDPRLSEQGRREAIRDSSMLLEVDGIKLTVDVRHVLDECAKRRTQLEDRYRELGEFRPYGPAKSPDSELLQRIAHRLAATAETPRIDDVLRKGGAALQEQLRAVLRGPDVERAAIWEELAVQRIESIESSAEREALSQLVREVIEQERDRRVNDMPEAEPIREGLDCMDQLAGLRTAIQGVLHDVASDNYIERGSPSLRTAVPALYGEVD